MMSGSGFLLVPHARFPLNVFGFSKCKQGVYAAVTPSGEGASHELSG